jgi:hypothetical protein
MIRQQIEALAIGQAMEFKIDNGPAGRAWRPARWC